MMQKLNRVFLHWLPLGVAVVLMGGLFYGMAQQIYREGLNDPQIQMVEDAQTALLAGEVPAGVVPRNIRFDAGTSLLPFIAVFDKDGTPLESDASVNNEPPRPPLEALEASKAMGENRVTWQPAPGTRIALVVRPVTNGSGYFVAAGRNMREVESRISALAPVTLLVIIITLIATFLLEMLRDAIRGKMIQRQETRDQ